jgi:uncharacterized protein YabN with tetrapyrrole methylase and pyrophosphatase domain
MSNPFRKALEVQRVAAGQGFDWNDQVGLWDKLAEEIGELRAAETNEHRQEELGDLLFMIANIARHLGLDPEAALAAATTKFSRRYAHVEQSLARLPPLGDPSRLQAMEVLWQEAKSRERAVR